MTIQFTKMQGAGNDYIYVNTINQPVTNPKELAIQWSTYHTGIGSDGLVLIGPYHIPDFSMRIFNADGSEAKMCGNASRCIGKYLYDKKLTQKKQISLETLSGIKHLELHVKNGAVKEVTVDMGCPEIYRYIRFHGKSSLRNFCGGYKASQPSCYRAVARTSSLFSGPGQY